MFSITHEALLGDWHFRQITFSSSVSYIIYNVLYLGSVYQSYKYLYFICFWRYFNITEKYILRNLKCFWGLSEICPTVRQLIIPAVVVLAYCNVIDLLLYMEKTKISIAQQSGDGSQPPRILLGISHTAINP